MTETVVESWLVIPCFNEAERFDEASLLALLESFSLVIVDDGSLDHSWERITELTSRHKGRMHPLRLKTNQGKGEAVRAGLNFALEQDAKVVGYLDADFSVPATEMLRLQDIFSKLPETRVLLASRWLRLGADIQRSNWRHYLGRVFATFASMLLGIPVYDTQCGAKLFKVDSRLVTALREPFISRWAFDVELLGRLLGATSDPKEKVSGLLEVPVNIWTEKAGSKLNLVTMLQSMMELWSIYRSLKKWQRGKQP